MRTLKFMNFKGDNIIRLVCLALCLFLLFALAGCKFPGDTTTPATLAARKLSATPTRNTVITPEKTDDFPTIKSSITPSLIPFEPTTTSVALPDPFSLNYPLGQIGYVIPLTVRHVSEDSASLFFELDNAATGSLVYKSNEPDGGIRGSISLAPDTSRHMLTIEGLKPGVEYQAMVLVEDRDNVQSQPGFNKQEWGVVSFRTASANFPIRVGILGDASFGDQATQSLVEQMVSQNLDFVLNTGDIVYETDSSNLVNSYVTKFFEPFSPLLHKLPVYTVLGNHDYDRSVEWQGAPFYDYAFPPVEDQQFSYPASRRENQYYAFSYMDVQFLMLDSQTFFGVDGRADQDMWLQERLADPRFRITIPIFHVSPYSSSVVHPDDGLPIRYSWNPLFEAGNVPVTFSGHYHHYERHIANGITYIVTGGGSSTLYAQGESLPTSQIYVRRTHFVFMEIYDDRIEINAISKEGETFDQATISLN